MEIVRVSSDEEINGIYRLHCQNHRNNLSADEMQQEGFVSATYDFDLLKKMNGLCPSIIAKVDKEVVGYALVVTRDFYGNYELLDDLFNSIDLLSFNAECLKDVNYVMVGQLCVAKEYRGMGVVQQMYNCYKEELCGKFKYCLTDIAENNPRSLKAHLKSGFQVIDTKGYAGLSWDIILWDWNQ